VGEALPIGEIRLASLQLFYGTFVIFDLDSQPIPVGMFPSRSRPRDLAMQHPAILTISPPDTRFMQERFSVGTRVGWL